MDNRDLTGLQEITKKSIKNHHLLGGPPPRTIVTLERVRYTLEVRLSASAALTGVVSDEGTKTD